MHRFGSEQPGAEGLPSGVGTSLSPRLARALRYWREKRGGRTMPARKDIRPEEIKDLLPHVVLMDVYRDPLDFRYRVIGTAVVAISRSDLTGRKFSEIPGKGPGSVLWSGCEDVVAARTPLSRVPPYVGPETRLRKCANILLPLSDDDQSVNMILKVIDFAIA